jgi:hypothetical protein
MEQGWEAIWRRLATSDSLQTLKVVIFNRCYRLPEALLLNPLSNVQVSNFAVQLPWRREYIPEYSLQSDCGTSFCDSAREVDSLGR